MTTNRQLIFGTVSVLLNTIKKVAFGLPNMGRISDSGQTEKNKKLSSGSSSRPQALDRQRFLGVEAGKVILVCLDAQADTGSRKVLAPAPYSPSQGQQWDCQGWERRPRWAGGGGGCLCMNEALWEGSALLFLGSPSAY